MKKLFYLVIALLIVNVGCNQKPTVYKETEKAEIIKPDSVQLQEMRVLAEHFFVGQNKYRSQDYEGAIAEYTKAIKMQRGYSSINLYLLRGEAKHAHKDYAGAIADFTKALENSLQVGEVYYNIGLSKFESKDYNGSINDFTKAIKFDPNNMGNYYYRGLAKIESGDKSNGCLDLKKAADFNNPDAKEAIKEYCQ